ncbi:MAG TPA: hypothetical protein VGG51_13835 [Candidatus Cybelea sp.]|jgi:hypothetical protein
MTGQQDARSFHAWSYLWSVLGSLTATAILIVVPKAVGIADIFGKVASNIPLWISFPVTFLALLGLISIVQRVIALSQPERLHFGNLGPITVAPQPRGKDIDISLRSIAPLIVLFTTQVPQISLTLRLTNLSLYDVEVTHLKAVVWFSQPTTELILSAALELRARSIRDDIYLNKLLEGKVADVVRAFFDRDEPTKQVHIDITVSGTSEGGSFQTGQHFSLGQHDIKGIER